MEFKVREVEAVEEKSVQQVEEALLKKHEEQNSDEGDKKPEEGIIKDDKISDEGLLSELNERFSKKFSSFDDLFKEKESKPVELPGDVQKYLDFKNETGRGIDDFAKVSVNYDDMEANDVLMEYIKVHDGLSDSEDIRFTFDEEFGYDKDVDDDKDIRRKELNKKRKLKEAKEFFSNRKEKYKIPTESVGLNISNDEKDNYESYKKYIKDAESVQDENIKKSEYFKMQTDNIFSDEFKGFEYNVGDKKLSFLAGTVDEVKEGNSDISNFISKFLDKEGRIKDAEGYHKSLSVALNPDKFAQHFYEQGKSDAIDADMRESKNVNLDVHQTTKRTQHGLKVRAMNNDSGSGLKVRKLST